jgi:hypothetical protein
MRKSAFFVIDVLGEIYFFDLNVDLNKPLFQDFLEKDLQRNFETMKEYFNASLPSSSLVYISNFLDISMCRPGSAVSYISVVSEDGDDNGAKVRRLNDGLFASNASEVAEESAKLLETLDAWAGRVSFDSVFRFYDEEKK